jgi:hypothetical protein
MFSVLFLTSKTSILLIFDTHKKIIKKIKFLYSPTCLKVRQYLYFGAPIIIFELVGRFVKQWDMLEEKFSLISKIRMICKFYANFYGISMNHWGDIRI